ncbi:MAG: bifunctional adenosylcobinamide kinase/adenosylcobinamide-phosphate guanylyltransferase [Candidatus Infernicultor aquiphilus]|uniref:Adenosylcobinamide kinase n=1 Tax=Candidatus Infernicultor aquiphilus TaxID=1805029 RepID=A0A1J5GGM8_9BACT|nr:bifunctional adenosylcobinamide kinase/adenosylcobinamide-phosphate guanylyltransferase [bacterium]OIP71957.1 MAG: bifunctional adenosylcobinamide kinase/adenosylcobinamide-phosphate guanylyltransferase [Candidatus Atribacteria bacterium CG2_30_33_13]PIU24739.1 MAG: bifunctional adenosylcobinamide kinase/adenosylcobinamide-phosphate guanylyltransferase [Candidatus Atribacteria bacterium CG08_land_8_20_14_0_20_33_29]PIW11169.1 MAG: bifunctional adenosylcobinamide kinase/adenosylcobinamide-phos
MHRGKLIFITGGARSGKSNFAEKMALSLGKTVVYLATGQPLDKEMAYRIKKHKTKRPAEWETYEEPIEVSELVSSLGREKEVILIDCLTLLVSNLLLREKNKVGNPPWEEKILLEIEKLTEISYQVPAQIIIVSNEVGMGLVPDNPLGRVYRDILGRANSIIAHKADEVFMMISGIPLKIKG